MNKNETVKTHRELKNLLKNVYDCAWTVFGSFFFYFFFFTSLVSVECEIFLYTLCVNALGRVKRSDELKLIRLPMIWDPKPISVYKRNVHLMMSSATWKTKHTHTSFFYLMSCFRSVCLPLICLFDLYICVPFWLTWNLCHTFLIISQCTGFHLNHCHTAQIATTSVQFF